MRQRIQEQGRIHPWQRPDYDTLYMLLVFFLGFASYTNWKKKRKKKKVWDKWSESVRLKAKQNGRPLPSPLLWGWWRSRSGCGTVWVSGRCGCRSWPRRWPDPSWACGLETRLWGWEVTPAAALPPVRHKAGINEQIVSGRHSGLEQKMIVVGPVPEAGPSPRWWATLGCLGQPP